VSKRVASLIIAIDGPAASGKSTTAKLVADRLGYTYINSGAMYRAVALRALREGVATDDEEGLARVAREASIDLGARGEGPILLDGEDVTDAVATEEVSLAASHVSTVSGVRRELVRQQRAIGHATDCVMEGRDIGTVVFPDADLKVFLTASLEERARRRRRQAAERSTAAAGEAPEEDEARLPDLIDAIRARDERDSTRRDSPLRKAADAVELDTTALTVEEQVDAVVRLAVARGAIDLGSA
jgi:cytidylate kinase